MISIITSLYKSERYLKSYLNYLSIVAKELQDNKISFEAIVIANDISHKEEALLSNFEKENKYLRVIKVKREPLYTSWNRGIRESKYDHICFWNVDDKRFVKGLMDGIKLLEDNFRVVAFPFIYKRYINLFNINFLVKIKNFYPKKFDINVYQKEMYLGPFFMFNKDVINKVGYFDDNFKIAGDFDWQARCARDDIKIGLSQVIAGIFTNNGKTLSGSKNLLQKEENDLIQSRYIKL